MRLFLWQKSLEVQRCVRRTNGDLVQVFVELDSLQAMNHIRQIELVLHLLRIACHQGAHQSFYLPKIAFSVFAFLGQYAANGVDNVNR